MTIDADPPRRPPPPPASLMRQLVRAMGSTLEQVWRQHAPRIVVGSHVEVTEFERALQGVCEAAAAPLSFVFAAQERERTALAARSVNRVTEAAQRTVWSDDDDDEDDRVREARISAGRKMRR